MASKPPAAADGSGEVALRLEAPADFHMYSADEGVAADTSDFVVPVSVVPSDGGQARNVKVVVDASGLKGIARAGKGGYGNCTGEGPVFTCLYGDLENGGDGEANAPFTLHGVDGVEPGDSGTVTYTATADNAAPVTGTTRMIVDGPTLGSPEADKTVKDMAPGKSRPLTPEFANHSQFTTERGVALQLSVDGGLLVTARPGNCYFDPKFTSAWCRFSTKAAPGTAYRTSSPIRYTAAPGKVTGTLTYKWSSEPEKPEGLTLRGEGPPLTLTRTTDRGLTRTSSLVRFETTLQADYEPVTATVRGRVGDTVRVRLGVRDHGPDWVDGSEAPGGFKVIPPEGTTVTSVPYTIEEDRGTWACRRPEKPGGAFVCDLDSMAFADVLGQGGTTAIDFHIRIDRQVPGAKGTIRTYSPYDRTPGNDLAYIPLDASPAPPSRDPRLWAVGIAALLVLAGLYRYRRCLLPQLGRRG